MLYTRVDIWILFLKLMHVIIITPGEFIDLAFNLNKRHFFDLETEEFFVKHPFIST